MLKRPFKDSSMVHQVKLRSLMWLALIMLCPTVVSSVPECNTSAGAVNPTLCTVTSAESGFRDDSETTALCPDGYKIVDCQLAKVNGDIQSSTFTLLA